MEINWIGHSCFRLKGNQALVITDPFPPDLGYSLGKQTANIVTISHQHPSHSFVQGIGGEPRVISGPGEYEIRGVLILGLPTFHDAEKGQKWGKNTVYLMEMDGVAICHLGDLGHALNDDQVEEIGNVDVLLLPVGGGSTMGAAMAAEAIRKLEPKAVIPMHYKTPVINRELDPVDAFLKEMGLEPVEPCPKLTVSKSNLPASTQVFILNYSG